MTTLVLGQARLPDAEILREPTLGTSLCPEVLENQLNDVTSISSHGDSVSPYGDIVNLFTRGCYLTRMSDITLSFGEWLGDEIDQRNYPSVRSFALHHELNPASVARWVSDERVPDPPSCAKLAVALNIDVDIVLAKAGHRHPHQSDIDIDDPLLNFFAHNSHKLSKEQRDALLRLGMSMIERTER